MARRKDSPQKAAMREMMRDYLKNNDISIKDGTDVNSIMRDMMSVLLEGALDEELDEELGYSKYDYRNKEKRRDSKGRILHTGESQRTDGKYLYKYVDAFGNTKYVYAWRLTESVSEYQK